MRNVRSYSCKLECSALTGFAAIEFFRIYLVDLVVFLTIAYCGQADYACDFEQYNRVGIASNSTWIVYFDQVALICELVQLPLLLMLTL